MKRLGTLILLMGLLLPLIQAFTLESEPEIAAGQSLHFSGQCAMDINLSGAFSGTRIFGARVHCTDQSFAYIVPVGFMEPAGSWMITGISGNEKLRKNVIIRPNRESRLLVVEPIDVIGASAKRGQTKSLRVRVLSDNEPVPDAQVRVWGLGDLPARLESKGNNFYEGSVQIPLDFETGSHGVAITALKSGLETQAGSYEQQIHIEKAGLVLRVLSPSEDHWHAQVAQTMVIEITYDDGTPLLEPRIVLIQNEIEQPLEQISPTRFSFTQKFEKASDNEQLIRFQARDKFGNETWLDYHARVSETATGPLLENPLLFGSMGLGLVLLGAFLFPWITRHSRRQRLIQKKHELEMENEELQRAYFEQNTLDKKTFEEKSKTWQKKMSEIENALGKY